MQELILQSETAYPPKAQSIIDYAYGYRIKTIDDSVHGEVWPFRTHGETLTGLRPETWAELHLLHLVMRCLADLPGDRPHLYELSKWAHFAEVLAGYDGPDDWFRDLFSSPPDVSKPLFSHLANQV